MKGLSALAFLSAWGALAFAGAAELEEVASFPEQQVTGVAVSKEGRVFVSFPNWSDDHTISVAELIDGQPKPFPNELWNSPGPAPTHFVCVQSVVVDADNFLWVLDPASPKMQGVVPGGPKLVQVNLATNKFVRIIPLDEVAKEKSYLNDVRIDTRTRTAFITDSGQGAIVVVDLKTGDARRLLDGHPSTQPEPDVKLTVGGFELLDAQKKGPPQIAADGIALDADAGYLYYHALTGHTLHRIKTSDLRDAKQSREELESKVENLGDTPAPDGMIEGSDGSIYLTALEQNAIVRWDAATKKISPVLADKRLSWPDTLAWGPDGSLYVTASQIQNMPRFHDGKSMRTEPYRLFRISGLAAQSASAAKAE